MKLIGVLLGLVSSFLLFAGFRQSGSDGVAGRWDLTVQAGGATYPSWIEVTDGTNAAVRVVGRTGSVHPATDVKVEGSGVSFTENGRIHWKLALSEGKLTGTQTQGDVTGQVTSVRAPELDHEAPAAWSKPQPLFNGKNLDGWIPDNPSKNHWVVQDGVLVNQAPGANIRTERKFNDFKLHVEYNCPQEGNSGVYLRGRYETQVEYEAVDKNDKLHSMGSIYGFIPPAVPVSPRPGEWESYDITLVGRTVTVIRDGVKTIDAQKIPGITGGALNSHEGESGPIYIQGDHTGGMKYRNITIAVPAT
jgi:Domain of Unknown Function (DUF1080)